MFYYASQYLFSNDVMPITTVEFAVNIIFYFIGNISMSILIGMLSSILS